MSHDEWVEAAGQLEAVFWHIRTARLDELLERMHTARYLLEDQQNPGSAARKLAEIGEIVFHDADLARRLARHEQGLTRDPKVLIRISQLKAQWAECSGVDERLPVAVAGW